jgi:hypothetical protein
MPRRVAGLACRRLGNSNVYSLDMPLDYPWDLQMEWVWDRVTLSLNHALPVGVGIDDRSWNPFRPL